MDIDVAIIGAGAAGCFAAAQLAERAPQLKVEIFESGSKVCRKVKISGGGRCNVTHACFAPAELVKRYPRGHRELRGPFHLFGPAEMMRWLEGKGVALKTESDGRVFPQSDRSQSIMDALLHSFHGKIPIHTGSTLEELQPRDAGWQLTFKGQEGMQRRAKKVLLACACAEAVLAMLENLGQDIQARTPSLFTFISRDTLLQDLSGLSIQDVGLELQTPQAKHSERGPVLITHWGLSGPAIIRLSAWAARDLAACDYRGKLLLDLSGGLSEEQVLDHFNKARSCHGKSQMANTPLMDIPKRLWKNILAYAGIESEQVWSEFNKSQRGKLLNGCRSYELKIEGKGSFKEEFVTSGGVGLRGVNFKSMESKSLPGIYFAGEILDIDGITGGFNFQSAWTTAYIATTALARSADKT